MSTVIYAMFSIAVALLPILFYAGFILLIVFVIMNYIRTLEETKKNFATFASMHGLAYLGKADPRYAGMLPGYVQHLVEGTDSKIGKQVQLFHFDYTTGSGKNQRTYYRTVIAIRINPTKAHIFLNSRINDATEQINLSRSERYAAEGTFAKYFDIYSPKSTTLSALSIFAPDTMALVMADYGFYDIEIVDDILYLYDYTQRRTVSAMESLYHSGLHLANDINTNTPKKLKLQHAQGAVSPSAITALKSGNSLARFIGIPLVIAVFWFGVNLSAMTISPKIMVVFLIAMIIIVPTGVVWTLIAQERRKQNYLEDRLAFAKNIRK